MIEFGCLARYFNDYRDEVQFAKDNGFSFMQIWYDNKGLNLKPIEELLPVILDEGSSAIINAVLDINEIPDQIYILKELLIKLGHKQLIIHPICKSEPITDKTIHKLIYNMHKVVEQLKPCGITVFIENNSKLDPIFTSPEELKVMFSSVPELEFLLDIAHMDSIEHLKELVSVKMPKILHIADRRLEEIHEHLPIGKGNIDFREVFNNVLPGFEGKIVFEIIQSDEDIIAAKKYFEDLLCLSRRMPMKCFTYSEMKTGQEQLVSDMVWEVFEEFVAPGYLPEGIETFRCFIQVDELIKATESGKFFTICCWDEGTLAGSITIRDGNHISLLFVKKDYHQQRIAKELFNKALKKCNELKPDLTEITVNSSPYAADIYKRLGFSAVGEQTTQNGITYIQMKIKLDVNILIHEMQISNYNEFYKLWSNTPGMGLSDADSYENIDVFLLRNKGLSFVCRHEDRIIGTILCGHDGRRGYIYHVTVAEKYRGRGIGRTLVKKSLQKLKEEGIQKCHLFVFTDNEIGNTFWSTAGWIKREDIYVYSKNT